MTISENAILVGVVPYDSRWPAKGAIPHFDRLHDAVENLRDAVRVCAIKVSEIEKDSDLSDEGRRRRKADIGISIIREIQGGQALAKARGTVEHVLSKIAERMGLNVKPPANAVDQLLFGEIRSYVGKLPAEKRLDFLRKQSSDARVATAVLHAPAFLSSLSNEEHRIFGEMVAHSVSADDVELKKEIEKAAEHLEAGARNAARLVGERCGLVKTNEGWVVPGKPAGVKVT